MVRDVNRASHLTHKNASPENRVAIAEYFERIDATSKKTGAPTGNAFAKLIADTKDAERTELEIMESEVIEPEITEAELRAQLEAAADSDLRVSMIFANQVNGQFLYEHGGSGWRYYKNGSWTACTKREQFEFAKQLGPYLLSEASRIASTNTDAAKRLMTLARRAMSSSGIKAAIDLATSDERIAATQEQFDTHRHLLNVNNGVINLNTGTLMPHDPALYMVKQSPIDYDPDAQCPEFDKFINEISKPRPDSEADSDWTDYIQRALGYTLSGNIDHEKLFFMLGGGSNGKSVLANVMMHIMGPLACVLPTGVLMSVKNRGKDEATPSKARLVGTRLAFANEVEEGARFDDAAVKELASKDAMSVRLLHQNSFSFYPSHKLWMRGNRKPIISATDNGIWRRIDLIPFDRQFSDHEKDVGLEARLKMESAGILTWLVRGYEKYKQRGLTPAKRVISASHAYRKESDLLAQWIDETGEISSAAECLVNTAFRSYVNWCHNNEIKPWSKITLSRNLSERGISVKKNGGKDDTGKRCDLYIGLKIAAPMSEPVLGRFS